MWIILVILIVVWALGFGFQVTPLVHLLLVVALLIFILNLIQGRRSQ